MSIVFFVNVWRKNIFDIYVTEYGTALTNILPILFLYSPLQKIEISSNGQKCSILNQNVSKFELYKHNDELFNMYYRFFMNFGWKSGSTDTNLEGCHPRIISAKFGWYWLCSFRGEVFF
jgi:hypothetical protein